ncbi:MAG: M48 family metallopeptidase [Bacteroidota bacterium]|nr:M48 family metallopeptidase [Bacteroidota bacterium]
MMDFYFKPNTPPNKAGAEVNDLGLLITLSNGIKVQWDKSKIHKSILFQDGNYIIQYGDEPIEKFETADKSIMINLHKQHPKSGFHIPKKSTIFKGASVFILIIVFIILFFVGFYTIGLDWIARGVASALPVSTEESIGQTLYESAVPSSTINIKKTKLLNDFFKQLNYPSDYHIQLTYIDSNMINAFALPGGHLVVMSGIIKEMKSYEELAALIGHEISHINGKHVTRSLVRTAGAYILISAVIGDLTGIAAAIAENGDALRSLQFSRDLETEADEKGLELMQKNNINPDGILKLFERLKKAEQGGPSEFLSTHPATDNRIQHIKEKIVASHFQTSGTGVNVAILQTLFEQIRSSQ